jgi:hypothetical protein
MAGGNCGHFADEVDRIYAVYHRLLDSGVTIVA